MRKIICAGAVSILLLVGFTGTISAQPAVSGDLNAVYDAGVTAFNQGDLQTARAQFEQYLKYQPENTIALSYLGVACYKLGSFEAAVKALREVLRIDPNKLEVNYDLGLAYMAQADYRNALPCFQAAKKYYGDNPDVLYNKAMAHYQLGQLDETIQELETLMKKNPNYGYNAQYILAQAYFYKGMADEAATYFNTVERMAPDDTAWDKNARAYIAQIEQKKGLRLKELTFSLYTNYERDSNVNFTATPVATDADNKTTLYASLGYRPVFGGAQPLKVGYSYYNLMYATHPDKNFLGHMGELSYNFSFAASLLALKLNANYYIYGGSPYQMDIPIDCRYTFKVLPWASAWSIVYVSYIIDTYPAADYQQQNSTAFLYGLKQFITDYLNVTCELKTSRAQGTTSSGTLVDNYSYSSNIISANYLQPLPYGFSLSLDGSFTNKNYAKEDSTAKTTKRTDQITSMSATLSKTLIWDIGLLLKVGSYADNCNLTAAQSALGYGSYSSNTTSLGLSMAF